MSGIASLDNTDLRQVKLKNDRVADRAVVMLCSAMAVFLLFLYIYTRLGGIEIVNQSVTYYFLGDEVLLLISVLIYCTVSRDAQWPRFLYIGVLMTTSLVICSVLSLSYLIFAIPIMIVTSYYNWRMTLIIAVAGAVVICAEPFIQTFLDIFDLDFCDIYPYGNKIVIVSTPMEVAVSKLVNSVLPTLPAYAVLTVLSVWVTSTGLSLVKERTALVQNTAAIENELNIAAGIQMGMLPDRFPDTESYSIKAVMKPAKDVGGDFYDFMYVGASRVAFLIADVSGKGIPAALFMASARTLFRNNLKSGLPADEVMDRTNAELCNSNREKLFVTAWLGIIDLTTGSLSYVNAGHNPPFIIYADGRVDSIVQRPNFVLGRKRNILYREHRIMLAPGDRVFLFTDGLTDQVDTQGHMFGLGNAREALASVGGNDLVGFMTECIDRFSQGTEQFDDITMLLFDFKGLERMDISEGECFSADPEGHNAALAYIRGRLSEGGCTENVMKDIGISASEVISNINQYAYGGRKGTVRISADVIGRKAVVVFRDDGPEYNPLGRSGPDLEKRIKEHKIGGFGIYIVRKLMDDVRYERTDGQNILTMTKEI